jgi:amidase
MRTWATVVFLFAAALAPAARAQSAGLAGTWEFTTFRFGEPNYNRVKLEVNGEAVTGKSRDVSIAGTLRGQNLELEYKSSNGRLLGKLKGTVSGNELSGDGDVSGTAIRWTARRAAPRPAAPRTHAFEPKEFHRFFSSAIPPALRIAPGDTVRTWSVDAGGTDAGGTRRSLGGNPQTGPFYVEGAMPGDTLVVHLRRVRLNRDSAGSGDSLVPTTVGPGYVRNAKRAENFDSNWKLDREQGVAMLAKPTDRLKNLRIPLAPMLGCVAVAPPGRESFRTGNLGSWGGNMDYNQIREGTTLYFPVYHPGALLFVGDGHAAQGDGELTGDALETSMEIEFSVDVIEDQDLGMLRAENDEYVMAIGIAGSLPDAFKRATTDLALWLEREYKLSANESAMLLGFALRYDVAELIDPQINIVAKIPKSVLRQLSK